MRGFCGLTAGQRMGLERSCRVETVPRRHDGSDQCLCVCRVVKEVQQALKFVEKLLQVCRDQRGARGRVWGL